MSNSKIFKKLITKPRFKARAKLLINSNNIKTTEIPIKKSMRPTRLKQEKKSVSY